MQEEPVIERRCCCADVAHQLHTCFNDVRQGAEGLDVAQTVIGGVWFHESWKTSLCPVELTSINDDAANGCAVTADELGGGVNNYIGSMLKGLHQVRCGQRIIDHERNAVFMRNIGYRANIQGIQARIANRLSKDRFGAIIDSGPKVLRVAAVHETHSDTNLR